jgi:hypothetical protein
MKAMSELCGDLPEAMPEAGPEGGGRGANAPEGRAELYEI